MWNNSMEWFCNNITIIESIKYSHYFSIVWISKGFCWNVNEFSFQSFNNCQFICIRSAWNRHDVIIVNCIFDSHSVSRNGTYNLFTSWIYQFTTNENWECHTNQWNGGNILIIFKQTTLYCCLQCEISFLCSNYRCITI